MNFTMKRRGVVRHQRFSLKAVFESSILPGDSESSLAVLGSHYHSNSRLSKLNTKVDVLEF